MNKKNPNCITLTVTTLGCKVNQFESESICSELRELNRIDNNASNPPEICIINTCTVTQKASMQSRQAIRKAIKNNPNAIIIATGCYAQSEPMVLSKIQGLDYIIGNADKHRISNIIAELDKIKKHASPVIVHKNIMDETDIPKTIAPIIENRTRPFIKIQDGCDNFCTYCIVPYTRGPSRSVQPDDVLNIIDNLPTDKKEEIVLTGIHMGRYGMDLSPPCSLVSLLKQLHHTNRVKRIRLSSIEPVEITDELINFMAESGRVCHHLHIPLQSGDKHILKRMNRPYDPELFKNLIFKIHRAIPDIAIGIDVMVGFPGETDDAFMNTYDLLAALPIAYLHVFPYSSRPGTKASSYPDHVEPRIIKHRRNRLLELSRKKKSAFYAEMIGKTLDILIEDKRDTLSGQLTGLSSNYVRAKINGNDSLKNQIVPCRVIKKINKDSVYADLLQD